MTMSQRNFAKSTMDKVSSSNANSVQNPHMHIQIFDSSKKLSTNKVSSAKSNQSTGQINQTSKPLRLPKWPLKQSKKPK